MWLMEPPSSYLNHVNLSLSGSTCWFNMTLPPTNIMQQGCAVDMADADFCNICVNRLLLFNLMKHELYLTDNGLKMQLRICIT